MADLSFSFDASRPPRGHRAARTAQLNLATLGGAAAGVRKPAFDVGALQIGIAHIGCGAFHRAHQALLTQRAIEAEGGETPAPWGIAAISMKTDKIRQTLHPQEGLYTVLERGEGGTAAEIVGTLRSVISSESSIGPLSAAIASPAIKLVTLTVTAAGYCLDTTTGRLAEGNADIRMDLQGRAPRSAIGLLAEGLEAIRKGGQCPPVILACDNLPHNGDALRRALLDFVGLKTDILANWIERGVQFPNSVVDRIVPAPGLYDRVDAIELTGLRDNAPVAAEPFKQWVIADFEGPRPLWNEVGVEFVSDVTAWENSKLRLLNGPHLAMAFLGALSGLRTVSEVMSDPDLAACIERLIFHEHLPTIPPAGHDLVAYGGQLIARWRNPGIAHQLSRIGRDSSDKMQPRLVQPLVDNLRAARPTDAGFLALAAWAICMCCPGACEPPMEDTLSQRFRRMGEQAAGDAGTLAHLVLTIEPIFDGLAHHPDFSRRLAGSIALIQRVGPRAAARYVCSGRPS